MQHLEDDVDRSGVVHMRQQVKHTCKMHEIDVDFRFVKIF